MSWYERNKEKRKEYKKNNREKINAYAREYRKKNREKLKEWRKQNYQNKYQHKRKVRLLYDSKNRDKIKQQTKKWNELNPDKIYRYIHNKIRYKDKYVRLDFDPRDGICFFCKFETKTLIHHFEYDDSDPLKWTIEMCRSCHKKWHDIYGVPKGYINPHHLKGK